ncbi:hypothetical protein [Novosphingobium jiangmenense]|uniref:2OG-Fe(II) oxygenase n=1 Tax=Novosphingobium jiangmenense TaxID=2791981 RepID=A0ABS0HHN7_9SPHN|nr:hypothetical protein [Novosphingobium jiangmenense]MBF9151772.1 hypothetical protein [Novosphingobium jiangmenense]
MQTPLDQADRACNGYGQASMLIQPQGVIHKPGEPFFLNPALLALNVFETGIAPDVLAELEALAPETRAMEELGGRYVLSSGVKLSNDRPRHWRSDICWLSHADEESFAWFDGLYARLGLAELVAPFVPHDREVRLYAGFFVTRSRCDALDMHYDWTLESNEAFTLMAPLTANGGDLGMTYDTVMGERRDLAYRRGKGLVFGPSFLHSTAVGALDERAVFLCLNFGTDRMDNWARIGATTARQCELLRQPDGSFIRQEEWRRLYGRTGAY